MERESEAQYASWLLALLREERVEEERQARERIERWPRAKLEASGLALLGLSATKRRHQFYGRTVVRLHRDGSDLPFHRFAPGDLVTVTSSPRSRGPLTCEGAVIERAATFVDVALTTPFFGVAGKGWRLDKYYSASSYERMEAAVAAVTCVTSGFERREGVCQELRRVIVRSFFGGFDWVALAESPAAGLCDSAPTERRARGAVESLEGLDAHQRHAAVRALRRRVAVVQGPPGTGKTRVAAAIVVAALRLRNQDLSRKVKPFEKKNELPRVAAESAKKRVLACAGSHVAADNLLERLLDAGVDAVRLGSPASVREDLRPSTLDARVLLEQKNATRAEAASRVLRRADVVVASCVGAGGDVLAPFLVSSANHRNSHHHHHHQKRAGAEANEKASGAHGDLSFADVAIFKYLRFGLVVIDEAAQATEPTCLVPIAASLGATQLVMLGDHMQLPPTVLSHSAQQGGLGRSLFERLADAGLEPSLLTRQYRMHPAIAHFASRRFYDGRVRTCPAVAEARRKEHLIAWARPVAFVDVPCGRDQSDDASYLNWCEVAVVKDVVQQLSDLSSSLTLGVVSPYRAQARAIADALPSIEVNTVDAFQGREMDVVLISAVRANDARAVGFLADFRRLNVALTRARKALVVVGHKSTLQADPHWAAFIDYCSHRDCVLSATAGGGGGGGGAEEAADDLPPCVIASVDTASSSSSR